MGYNYIASIHMSAKGITIKKCFVIHMLGDIGARTRLSKSSIPSNTAGNESIYRPDQSVELELLGAHGNEYHAITSLVHAADKAGIGVHGQHRLPLHVKTIGAFAQQLSRHGW